MFRDLCACFVDDDFVLLYTAVSRKVVGRSARDNPERYCGWSCLPCSPKKFERMAREATDICSRVLMESNKSRFDSYSRQEQCIYHITFRDCCVHIFSDNLPRNSCIKQARVVDSVLHKDKTEHCLINHGAHLSLNIL